MEVKTIENLGLTRQREVVLRVIRDAYEHLTASEVFSASKEMLPTISFATVYNSLRFLKDAGHIAEIQFGNGASRFDRITHRHDHAICTGCGKLVDIEMEVPGDIIKRAGGNQNLNRNHWNLRYGANALAAWKRIEPPRRGVAENRSISHR